MNFADLLEKRTSVRAFSARPVSPDILDRLLTAALLSPSWSNTQPFKVAVATARVRDAIAQELCARFDTGMAVLALPAWRRIFAWHRARGAKRRPDYFIPDAYPADLQPPRRRAGYGLYEALGIARRDRAARDAQMRRNFLFFDAPVALFLYAHQGLGAYSVLDAGIFLQSLMLAATDAGLGTCAQGALAAWPDAISKHFQIPESYRLVCGLALGYAADHAVNQFSPVPKTLEDLVIAPRDA